jgi:hypothetical protein
MHASLMEKQHSTSSSLLGTTSTSNMNVEGDSEDLQLHQTALSPSGKVRLTLPLNQDHLYLVAPSSGSIAKLHSCICTMNFKKALVFVNHQREAGYVRQRLLEMGMEVSTDYDYISELSRLSCRGSQLFFLSVLMIEPNTIT